MLQNQEFESKFAKNMDASHALAVSSGTAALRVALAALGVGEEMRLLHRASRSSPLLKRL